MCRRTHHSKRSSNDCKGTLTPCVTCMPGLSYQDVMQVSAVEEQKKRKAWAGMQEGGHFQHATGSNYAKPVHPFDKDKREVGVKGSFVAVCRVIVIAAVRYCCPHCTYDE